MPNKLNVVDVHTTVGEFTVEGRLQVVGPHYIGADDPTVTYKGQSLAERIERAVTAAMMDFSADLMENAPVSKR